MGTTGGAVHAPTGAGGSNVAPNVRAIEERVELDRKVVEEPLWRFIEDMLKENHPSTNHDGVVWFDGLVWMCLVTLHDMHIGRDINMHRHESINKQDVSTSPLKKRNI